MKVAATGRLVALLAMALLPLLAVACPASESEGPGGTGGAGGAPCDAPNMVFKTTCTGANCHGPGPFPPDFQGDPTGLVVGRASISVAPCTGMPIVNAANPAASVLLTRINGATCGEQMPSNIDNPDARRPVLTQQQIDCVTSWVMSKKQ
jgi:hypothetical protein